MCEVQTISREVALQEAGLTPQRLHAGPDGQVVSREIARAYLLGASGDGTFNRLHQTFRFGQKEREWLETLRQLLATLESRAWIYREGKTRKLYILETTASCLRNREKSLVLNTESEQTAYVRGYFDAEGGIPQDPQAPFYVQFVQKNRKSLMHIRQILENLHIRCGVLHNPSRKVDPEYWRFFVRRSSHKRFIEVVGSWHPRKQMLLAQRVKI